MRSDIDRFWCGEPEWRHKIEDDEGRMKNLIAAIRKLEKAKSRAQALGIFTDDRELLECTSCGLMEDVTALGILVTYFRNSSPQEDSGLRFIQVDDVSFQCPSCGSKLNAVC